MNSLINFVVILLDKIFKKYIDTHFLIKKVGIGMGIYLKF